MLLFRMCKRNVGWTKMKNIQSGLTEKEFDDFNKAVEKFDLHTIEIFLAHPLDLLEMNMKKFPINSYFISVSTVKQGELLLIKNNELKEELYSFVKNNPDRVFRGERF